MTMLFSKSKISTSLLLIAFFLCNIPAIAADKVVTVLIADPSLATPIIVYTGNGAYEITSSITIDGWTRVDNAVDANGNAIVVPLCHTNTTNGVDYRTYNFKTLYNKASSSATTNQHTNKQRLSKEERREKRQQRAEQLTDWFEQNNFSLSKAVDLGLPSGNIWAGYNFGAESPLKPGSYAKWNPDYNIAYEWGEGWQMPSKADFDELLECCEWDCIKYNRTIGYRATGPNGNKIFFPIIGYYDDDNKFNKKISFYWTNENSTDFGYSNYGETFTVYDLKDYGTGHGMSPQSPDFSGYIRPVYKE